MKNDFRQLVDRNLSGLQWNDVRTQRVLHALEPKGERKMKKKFSMGLVLAVICVLLATVAVAAGLTYSQKYLARARADALLEEKYGITKDMQSFFTCIEGEMEGTAAYIYVGSEDYFGMLGSYTVVPAKNTAVWSWDGTPNGWGADKMADILLQCQEPNGSHKAASEAALAAQGLGLTGPEARTLPTEEEAESTEAKWSADTRSAQALAVFTMEEAESQARLAIQQKHQLTEEQMGKLEFVAESSMYCMAGETPLLSAYFWLCQDESAWTDKDGIYIVDVNLLDGSIDAIWYDTGLLGNG